MGSISGVSSPTLARFTTAIIKGQNKEEREGREGRRIGKEEKREKEGGRERERVRTASEPDTSSIYCTKSTPQ